MRTAAQDISMSSEDDVGSSSSEAEDEPVTVEALKAAADDCHKASQYAEACELYTRALEVAASGGTSDLVLVLHGNRSMSRLKGGEVAGAVEDGLQCLSIDPTYTKGETPCTRLQTS